MVSSTLDDVFCVYLWRSLDAPGTLYLARGLRGARAVYAEMTAAGYTVRVVHMVTNVEFEMRGKNLVPCAGGSQPRVPAARHSSQPVA